MCMAMYSRLGKNFITQRCVSPGGSGRKAILEARQLRKARGSGYLVLAPGADEAKLPDQVVEGGPEIVGYIPDEDSGSAEGHLPVWLLSPGIQGPPGGSVFHAIAGIQAAENLVCETDSTERAHASLGPQDQKGSSDARGTLRTRELLLYSEHA